MSRSSWWRSRSFKHTWQESVLRTSPDLSRQNGETSRGDDLDLEIQDREFVVLAGPPGCGISSIVRMIAGPG